MGALWAAALVLASRLPLLVPAPALPGPNEIGGGPDRAVETMSVLSLGVRRLGADLEFIRLLQYYGTPETGVVLSEAEYEGGGGRYYELLPRTERILDLDPFFSQAALFSAGALAFNLARPDEAEQLLILALKRDPGHWRYHAYLAAIGYQKAGHPEQVVRVLAPYVDEPDCPVMVRNVIAFLMRRAGRLDDAARVYGMIARTTRDPGYRRIAERALTEIAREKPRLRKGGKG